MLISAICTVKSEISSAKDRPDLGCFHRLCLIAQAFAREFGDWRFIHDIHIGENKHSETFRGRCGQDTGVWPHLKMCGEKQQNTCMTLNLHTVHRMGTERTGGENWRKHIESWSRKHKGL